MTPPVRRGSPDRVRRGSPDPAPCSARVSRPRRRVRRGSPDPAAVFGAGLPTPPLPRPKVSRRGVQTSMETSPPALLDGRRRNLVAVSSRPRRPSSSGTRLFGADPLGPRLCLGPHCPRGSASSSLPATNAPQQRSAQCSPDSAAIDGRRCEPSGVRMLRRSLRSSATPRRSLGTRKISRRRSASGHER